MWSYALLLDVLIEHAMNDLKRIPHLPHPKTIKVVSKVLNHHIQDDMCQILSQILILFFK